jgi:hypothetical protein
MISEYAVSVGDINWAYDRFRLGEPGALDELIHDDNEDGQFRTCMVAILDLRFNDATLIKALKEWIAEKRVSLNLPKPKPNEGIRRNPFRNSWKQIELFDRVHWGEVLSANDARLLRKAREIHKEWLATVPEKIQARWLG